MSKEGQVSDRSARDGDETEQDWDEVRACHDESYLRVLAVRQRQVYVRWDHTQGEWKIIAAFFPEVTPRPQS